MPEISKFYGIIIYMYIDDHRSALGRLPKQESAAFPRVVR